MIRQKQLFTIYGGLYQDSDGSNAYISTAPHYWVTKKAVNRSFKAWKKQLHNVMADASATGSIVASSKYSDFKILLDSGSTSNILSAKDASGTDLPVGEWQYSTLTMPRPDAAGQGGEMHQFESDQFSVMICGQHVVSGSGPSQNYTRVGAIQSWLDSRPIVNSGSDVPDTNPNTETDPLTVMFMTGDADEHSEVMAVIEDQNDTPPYDMDLLQGATTSTGHGANLQMQCLISPDDNSGIAQIPGFQALCGLVRIHVTGNTGNSGAALILDVESNGVGF